MFCRYMGSSDGLIDAKTCKTCLQVLTSLVPESISGNPGSMHAKLQAQEQLNKWGSVEVIVKCLGLRNDNLFDGALKLANSMMDGGNKEVTQVNC